MQSALNSNDGRSSTIFHEIRDREKQLIVNEDNRKNTQALLVLAQEFADTLERVTDKLNNAQTKIYELGEDIRQAKDKAIANASRTEDGRIVFKDKHGNIHALDGEPLTEEEAASIRWKENSTTWEHWQKLERLELEHKQLDRDAMEITDKVHQVGDKSTKNGLKQLQDAEVNIDEILDKLSDIEVELEKANQADAKVIKRPSSEFVPEISI